MRGAKLLDLPVAFTSAVTNHEASDAGYCVALGKPYITLYDEEIIHPLKEVDAAAMAWAQAPEQVVEIFKYVTGDE